jgi:hypothetical protein
MIILNEIFSIYVKTGNYLYKNELIDLLLNYMKIYYIRDLDLNTQLFYLDNINNNMRIAK